MKTTIQRAELPDDRRVLMISDVHGHADGLRAILKKAAFTPEDVLVIVGDLIEKGPQSLETVRLVMELCRTHTVYPLMGNVDLWRWEFLTEQRCGDWKRMREYAFNAVNWWGSSLLHEMCDEMGEPLTREADMDQLLPRLRERFKPEIGFLGSLPTVLETQRMIFVHGGIPHERLDELEGEDAFPILKYDDFYSSGLSFRKYVVVGHWPAVLYSKTYPRYEPLIDRQRHIISLDGACGIKTEGQLNLLILPDWRSDDYSLLTWDRLPVITALEGQAPSDPEEARYIPWNDHAVELLDQGEEVSRVLYHGRPMTVPTQYIFQHNGVLSCVDTTDYVLPVSPGDRLSLILKLNYGCFVKKDSVSGWYFGRYETNEVNEP
ncbi:MAG: metallophosphoesterase [Clostridia bacterium]|nr:metallophosphoesterase [Clostridia bacterium]